MSIKINEAVHGDCLDLFKQTKSQTVDLLLTDPPYKIIRGGRKRKDDGKQPKGMFNRYTGDKEKEALLKSGKIFKHNTIKFEEWVKEAFRVLKNDSHAYIFVNDRNMQELLNETTKAGFKLVNILVWKKNTNTPNRYYLKNAEFILMLRKGAAKNINNMGTKTVLEVDNFKGNREHPTQKPTELLEILINNSTQPNDIVLDPFLGSGSTAISALNTKRRFIGFELDKEYYDIATKRIKKIREVIENGT